MELKVLRANAIGERELWRKHWEQLPLELRDVYFSPEYLLAYEKEGKGEALCAFGQKGNSIILYPFLKCRIQKERNQDLAYFDIMSAYGYGGPLVNWKSEDYPFIKDFWCHFSEWCKSERVVGEFCRMHPLLQNERWAPKEMKTVFDRKTVVIDLSTYPTSIWKDPFYRVHRNMIRRAQKEGFIFKKAPTQGQMDWFSRTYNHTQDILGASYETSFSQIYFNVMANLLKERAWLAIVEKDESVSVCVLVIEGASFTHCHLMCYGQDRISKGVTNFIYHNIALDASERGKKWVHMGGGNSGDEEDALFKFKSSLSPFTRNYCIGMRCHNPEVYHELGNNWEKQNGPRPRGYFLFYRINPHQAILGNTKCKN